MYFFEISDLTFFINSLKHSDTHFNIKDFVAFSDSSIRSSSFNNINSAHYSYFNRLPCLWNSLP